MFEIHIPMFQTNADNPDTLCIEHDILKKLAPEFEGLLLETVLQYTGNRKLETANLLGWGRNTVTRKIKELSLS